MKWNEMKGNEMKGKEMKGNEMKWNEMKWKRKGNEKGKGKEMKKERKGNVLVVVEMMPQTVKYMHMYYYFMMDFHIYKYKAFNWNNGMEKVYIFMWPSYNKKEKYIY